MNETTILKALHILQEFGFENVAYDDELQTFHFDNQSDIMNNYVTIVYSSQFKRFNVRVYEMETSNEMELLEVGARLTACTHVVHTLNTMLEEHNGYKQMVV